MTQLRRNTVTQTQQMQRFQEISCFPYIYRCEWFKDNFQSDLFIAKLTGRGKARCGHAFEQLYDCQCISMPPWSRLPQAGHFPVMSLLHCFRVKSVRAGIFLVKTISTTLSPLRNADNKFFCRSQSYFQRHYLGCITDRTKSLDLLLYTQSSSSIKQCR